MNSASPTQAEKNFNQKVTTSQLLTSRRFIGAALLVALVTVGFFNFSLPESAPAKESIQPARKPLPVDVMVVSRVDGFAQPRSYTGLIRAARQSELGFKRADELVEQLIDEGDRVDKGQALARIDTRQIEARRRQLQAQISEAKAVYDELRSGPRAETIAAQQASVKDLKSQVALLELQVRRQQNLLEGKATSREAFEQATYGLASTRARLDSSQRQLDELLAGTRKERVDAQLAVIQQLEASLANVQIDIDDSLLIAPYDGFITRRYVDEGTIVSAGEPVFRIVEETDVEAWIGLPPTAARELAVNQRHTIEVHGRAYDATVRAILEELNAATRTRTAVFTLQSTRPGEVVPGEVARIEVIEKSLTEGFWVPTSSLARGSRGLWSVLALEEDSETVQRRDVEVVYTDGQRAIVRGTITDGDVVVTGGTHRVVAGQRVTRQNL